MINNADGKTLLRYDTLENWNRVNPVLAKGEFVIVIDNGKAFMKCGDGTKTFSALPYILGDNGEAKNVTWDEIIGKPTTFAPSEHNHDNLYYTESEIDTKLNDKQNVINDLETIRDGASKGATALQKHQDISGKVDWSNVNDNALNIPLNQQISHTTIPNSFSVLSKLNNYATTSWVEGKGYLTQHQDISNKADKSTTLAGYGITDAKISNGVITLGNNTIAPLTSYTEKYTGTYNKPSGGIPKTDLASSVQTSLGKADTALQSHQDISGKADTSTSIRFLNQENYVGARFYNTELATTANEKYIEWWQTNAGWFNFKLGNLNAVGDISATGKIYSNSKEVLTQHQDISGKFDKSGGTVTGIITFSEQDAIKKHNNTGSLRIYGGNSANSGAIILFGGEVSNYGGASVIRAKDNSKFADIWVYPDGTTSAPTPITSDNSTKIATTSFVKAQGYLTSVPKASTTQLGGIKVGSNLSIDSNGVLSAVGGSNGVTINDVYPVGSVYFSVNNTNPAMLFGGTWVSIGNNLKISSTDYFWGGIQIYAWKRTA